jgi:AAA+ superfamily predicted ATPase
MTASSWEEANKQYLMAAIGAVRETLERHALTVMDGGAGNQAANEQRGAEERTLKFATDDVTAPSALDALCAAFGLSPFERDIFLMCVGMELDSAFAGRCARAQGDPRRAYPTFGLALAALPGAHWSALTPGAPLRRLIEVGPGELLTTSPLRIDERVLHYVVGVGEIDERLAGIVEPVHAHIDLVPSHRAIAEQLVQAWSEGQARGILPVIQLCGEDTEAKPVIAAAACSMVGLNLCILYARAVPGAPGEIEALIRLWEREAALSASALLVSYDEIEPSDVARGNAVLRLIESMGGSLIVSSRERRRTLQRPTIMLDVHKPTAGEQRVLWTNVPGAAAEAVNGRVDALVSQFNVSTQSIQNARSEANARLNRTKGQKSGADEDVGNLLWDACRMQTRPRMGELAQRIESAATWDDLVLPELQKQTLREIAMHVRQRMKVYETWGFGARCSRGLGISVLFTGASGTGKTLAAEVLANELRLDLYRIDLSQVVSKYIGETEKNLRRVFDAADEGGAVLLFDEADALFGKRSEVKDSHDRYANIEVGYLLQRMEAYRGLAILTTNMKSALDEAFLRRIRFIVHYPFPDVLQRAEIWQRIFPGKTPTQGLKADKLARLNVTGGNIRNIALNAAFLAADAGETVGMEHMLRAARGEYAKLEKTLSDTEIRGWV